MIEPRYHITWITLGQEVLGIMIDTNLVFYSHLRQVCKKVVNKLNVLARIIPYLVKKPNPL